MKILFMISHPAHFWMFRYAIDNLKRDGHKVVIVIRPKDVLEQLCIDAGMEFYKVKNRPKKWGMFGLAIFLIEKIFEVLRIARKEKPDMLVGSDGVLAVVGKLIRRPAFEMYEDDAEAIALYARMFFPIYTGVVCPHCCSAWKWEAKKYSYPSYHELGYLHPNQFKPSREVVERYGIDTTKPYILVRFAQLTAHHDVGIHGINTEVAERMIAMLKPHGRIYITSERPLEPQFEQYRIRINPLDMHHVMAFASLYIGDSQTMAAEAGVVGTPFVRLNDFVGRLSYLHELEAPTDYTPRSDGYVPRVDAHVPDDVHYSLGYGHKTADVEGFFASIERWLAMPDRKAVCAERREKMLSEKVDYAKFLTWFIEEWPKSGEEMKAAPKDAGSEFWSKFK
jgi:predicted glycosyltransferase